ncbi:MAG: hypothetical protein HY326_02375 [Chloroflexi bacterium]|nr:hypothetical protein [Chloroflexota bacterium]
MQNALLMITDRTSPSNRYGLYLGEVLRAEGLNGFRREELSDITETLLRQSGVVVLTRCSVTEKTRDLFGNYVAAGGQLLILAPDTIWGPLVGLSPLPSGLVDGYLRLPITHEIHRGLPAETFQFHGVARYWVMQAAQVLAWLYTDAVTPTAFPAVALHEYGNGRVLSFSFDVCESIATMRQGNARFAYCKLDDANNGPRAGDLFGAGWIDVSKEHIPQADILQAYLARLIQMLSPAPLPRFWILPGEARALLLVTGDGEAADPASFQAEIEGVERYGGHITFYELVEQTQLSPAQVSAWRAKGHGFGLHPWAGPSPTVQLIRQEFPRQEVIFREKFGHATLTMRNHWLQWCGYMEQARLLAEMGILMDTNYVSTRPSHGMYMTGSGQPMRFVTETGEILPVWQQPTQMEDDVLLHRPGPQSDHTYNLSIDEGVRLSTGLLSASMYHYHTPVMMNVHPPHYIQYSKPWLDRTMAFARESGIPIWCAETWLSFLMAREAVTLEEVTYSDDLLRFSVSHIADRTDLTLLLPIHHNNRILGEIRCEGEIIEPRIMKVQQNSYAFISLDGGGRKYQAYYRIQKR